MTRITEHPTFEAAEHLERSCRHVARLARAIRDIDDQELRDLMRDAIRHGVHQIACADGVLSSHLIETPASAAPSL